MHTKGDPRTVRFRLRRFMPAVLAAAWVVGMPLVTAQQTPTNPGGGTSVPRPNPGGGGTVGDGTGGGVSQTTLTTSTTVEAGDGAAQEGAPDGVSEMIGDGAAAAEGSGRGTRVLGTSSGAGVSVTTSTGKGAYEPILKQPLPPGPIPADDGRVLTDSSYLDGGAMPVLTFLDLLYEATGWNILASPEVEQLNLHFWVTNMSPRQALRVLDFHGLHYEFDEETQFLLVRTKDEVKRALYGAIAERNYVLKHADLIDMEAIVTHFISPEGRVIAEPRTGQLLVQDTEANLEEISAIIQRLDVPIAPRTFNLVHINAEDVQDSLIEFLSERGLAHADPRTNTITVSDLPQRTDRIGEFLKTVDVPLDTRTWTLSYLDPAEIESRLETLIPDAMGDIIVDEDVRQVTITGLAGRLDEVDTLIKRWDVKRRQVEIEAYLVSAGSDVVRDFGINWFYVGDNGENAFALTSGDQALDWSRATAGQLLQVGTVPYLRPLTQGIPFSNESVVVEDINGDPIAIPGDEGLSVALEYLDDQGKVTILSRPRVVVLDGEEATFENTEDRPYQEGGYSQYDLGGTGNNNNNNFNRAVIPLQVRFITVGTILKVAPTIGEDNNIVMDISAEESTADTVTVTTGDQSSTIPQKRQSRTETRVMVHDQQTLVVGGLRSSTLEDDVTRVPLLGDIPLLGRLFKTTGKDHRERELLAFITPTIVDEFTMPEADKLAKLEQDVSKTVRQSLKRLLQRWETSLTQGKNEIHVAIGQDGALSSEGQTLTREEFEELLGGLQRPKGVTCVIRKHPRGPQAVYDDVRALAEQYGLAPEDGLDTAPFVPVQRPEAGTTEEEAAPAPAAGQLRNGVSSGARPR